LKVEENSGGEGGKFLPHVDNDLETTTRHYIPEVPEGSDRLRSSLVTSATWLRTLEDVCTAYTFKVQDERKK
jgi:hypothetical protein